jgi:methyl-accepting chemotaxis protein
LKLATKVQLLTVGLILALTTACGTAFWQGRAAQLANERTYRAETLATGFIAQASNSLWALRLATAQYRTLSDPDARRQLREGDAKNVGAFGQALASVTQQPLSSSALSQAKAVRLAFDNYVDARTRWFNLIEIDPTKAEALRTSSVTPTAGATVKAMQGLIEVVRDEGKSGFEQRNATLSVVTEIILLGGSLAVIAAAIASQRLVGALSRRMRGASDRIHAIAGLDLLAHSHEGGDDDLGELVESMESMRRRLAEIVQVVRASSEGVSDASAEIARGSLDLSMRTEQQAGGLQKTAASMHALSTIIRVNAENADTASDLAAEASLAAERGGDLVENVVSTMRAIDDSSKQIVDIISVIDGIAFQTNLLALNAAVEAARAGEQGRGFAVVAGEVRNLAKRTATAAREVKALIGTSVQRVEEGNLLVHAAGSAMHEVVQSIHRVAGITAAIKDATADQNVGIVQVNEAIAQMDTGTQQNAALSEQSAAAADALRQQAAALVRAMAVFQVDAVRT